MFEFSKLRWRIKEPSELEKPTGFITSEEAAVSNVYKNFSNPIIRKKTKIKKTTEKHVPGKQFKLKPFRKSILSKLQQEHCLKALKLFQSGKAASTLTQSEKFSIKIYTDNHSRIVEENKLFLQFAEKLWGTNKFRALKIRPGLYNYASYIWKMKCKRFLDYPQFYKEIKLVNLFYDESESSVNYECLGNILELGTLARFAQPSLKIECVLKISTLPSKQADHSVNSKLPVSDDKNILKLLETYNIDVVISSSGLKQIIDNTDAKSKWIIPVIIKEVEKNCEGQIFKKKIVFVDKCLPKITPNNLDFSYYTYKQLLKTNFCQYEAFKFPNEDVIVEDNDKKTIENNQNEEIDETNGHNQKSGRKINHNVNYRIWSIKKVNQQNNLMKSTSKNSEINLLVRSKLDACQCVEQMALQPVVIKPKIELQLHFGANIPTKSELSREWTSLFFRPYSNLYRARLHGSTSEIVSIEKCSLQKINTEAFTHYEYKPHLGLGVLQQVLQELCDLENGNYVLQHLPKHEGFVSILKECDESAKSLNFFEEYEKCEIDANFHLNWVPIDVNYILPVHEDSNQMPGLFIPNQNVKIKKKGKKKKKVKNKMSSI